MKEFRFDPEIHLSHGDIVPLRAQIIAQMQQSIIVQRVKPGTRVISERALSMKLGINRNTVHQAYAELIANGLLTLRSARGGVRVSGQALTFYKQPFPTIALVMPYIFTEQLKHFSRFGLEMFGGILDRATEKQVSVQIMALPEIDSPPEKIKDFLHSVISRTSGIIYMGKRREDGKDPVLTELLNCSMIPQVFISSFSPERPHISTATADLTEGVCTLLKHLKSLHIHSIGVFPAPEGSREMLDAAKLRSSDIKEQALQAGFTVREYPLQKWQGVMNRSENLTDLVQKILSDPEAPRCLAASNDNFACALADALRRAGKKIPEDFLLTGYDDLDPAGYSLSSLNHSRKDLGRLAVDMISELSERHSAGEALHKTVPTHFTPRGSTKLPR